MANDKLYTFEQFQYKRYTLVKAIHIQCCQKSHKHIVWISYMVSQLLSDADLEKPVGIEALKA